MLSRLAWVSLIILSGALVGMLFGASVPSVGSAAPDFTLNSAGRQSDHPLSVPRQMGGVVLLSARHD